MQRLLAVAEQPKSSTAPCALPRHQPQKKVLVRQIRRVLLAEVHYGLLSLRVRELVAENNMNSSLFSSLSVQPDSS